MVLLCGSGFCRLLRGVVQEARDGKKRKRFLKRWLERLDDLDNSLGGGCLGATLLWYPPACGDTILFGHMMCTVVPFVFFGGGFCC